MPRQSLQLPPIKAGVRFTQVEESFLIFDSTTGRYITLRGDLAETWAALATGQWQDHGINKFRESISLLAELELINAGDQVLGTHHNEGNFSGDIDVHSNFDHLILQDSFIDRALVGALGEVNLPPSNQRILMERFRVRTFVESFLEEAREFATAQNMTSFTIRLAHATVQVDVPAKDSELLISLKDAFFVADTNSNSDPDFRITVMDNSLWERKTQTYFEADWHFPLGIVDRNRTNEHRVAIDRHTQTVSAYSPRERACAVWMRDYSQLPYWSAATPLRIQLSWIADSLDIEFLHSAAVVASGKAILFAGPSGSGKSTLSLHLAQLGFPLISDDFLLATESTVQSVYRRLKVHDWSAERVIPTDWKILNPHEPGQKRIVDPGNLVLNEEVPIGAIVVPVVSDSFGLTPMTPSEALSAIAPASLSGLLGGNVTSLERIGKLVQSFPCYELRVKSDSLSDRESLLAEVNHISEGFRSERR
jgi:hypothetical protein